MEMTVLHTQRPYWVRSCQSSVFFWFVQFQTLLQTNYTAVVKQVYGYYTTVYCERSGEQNWVAKKTKNKNILAACRVSALLNQTPFKKQVF